MELKNPKSVNVDGMLTLVGEFGRYQWMMESLFCFMIIPRTYQILLMYFAALNPPWQCVFNSTICLLNGTMESTNEARCNMPRSEWEFTESKDYSIVTQFDIYCDSEWQIYATTSIVFIGWAKGAIITGWLADNYGRKNVLFPSLMGTLIVGLLTAFMPSIYPLIFCRYIIGFCLPGAGVQMFILISEMVGNKHRPMAGITLWFFFTIALCILGLKAYFIRTWKLLMICCTAPYLFVIIFYKVVPESFRWLHLHGKVEEAEHLFRKMAKWNKKEYPENVKLTQLEKQAGKHKSSIVDIFKTWPLAISSSIQGVAWFVNALVYYGIALAADDLGGSLYTNYVLVSAVEFPGAILAIFLCEKIGRKKTVMIPMILGSIACILIATIPNEDSARYGKVALGMFGKLCITISYDSIYTWAVELYPTTHRATGMGFLQITSRIGGASSPWVAKGLKTVHKALPFIVMGGTSLIAACFLAYLPETKGTKTCETNDDKEDLSTLKLETEML